MVKTDRIGVDLEIQYGNKKVRQLCEKSAVAEKKLGSACARKLRARLSDLETVKNVRELATGNPHPLKGDWAGHMAVSLAGGYRLVFAPANDPSPTTTDGGIDWTLVTIVSIEYIGDYHD